VIELLDRLTDRGVGSMTNRVFSIIRKLFNWCISRDLLMVSPCAGVRPPVPEVRRDRVLTDDELRWFWKATDKLGLPFGPLFKMLALTGQRLSEVAGMAPGEVKAKERLWTIPKARVKNNQEHDVPLSDAALAIIEAMPKIKGDAGHVYVFTTTGNSPVSGWSRAKNNLDKAMLEIARQEAEEAGDDPAAVTIPEWRLHDLRRTAASGMGRLGIHLPVTEKVLNHTSGSFAGIVGVYQRHTFADEKRQALDAWARFVASVVDKPADNVVPLRA
jgi:integrase